MALGLGLLFTLACTKYPPATDRLLEDLAVLTQYDVTINFSQYKTYQMSDSVVVITDTDSTLVKNGNTMTVVNSIASNMQARGYTRVTKNGDLAINVAYLKNTHVTAYYPGWYWGYYPPYWYGGYNYNYPYYPVYYTSYTSGTLLWDMVDLKYPNTEKKLYYIRWNAFIRGLMTGSHTMADISSSINQAFAQTPQINASGK